MDRKDKMGFPVPLNDWVVEPGIVRDFVFDTMSSERARSRFYFNGQINVEELVDTSSPYSRNLWAFLNLNYGNSSLLD